MLRGSGWRWGKAGQFVTENGVDCSRWLWFTWPEQGIIAHSMGEPKVGVKQGEVVTVNVFMGRLNFVELPSWE